MKKRHSVLITSNEVAKRWGISEGTLRNWRYLGKGPRYVKLSKGKTALVRYKLEEIIKWEQTQLHNPYLSHHLLAGKTRKPKRTLG